MPWLRPGCQRDARECNFCISWNAKPRGMAGRQPIREVLNIFRIALAIISRIGDQHGHLDNLIKSAALAGENRGNQAERLADLLRPCLAAMNSVGRVIGRAVPRNEYQASRSRGAAEWAEGTGFGGADDLHSAQFFSSFALATAFNHRMQRVAGQLGPAMPLVTRKKFI